MSCHDSTPNNRPVGVGYNSRNKPTSLAELTHISVSSIHATSAIHANTIQVNTLTASSFPLVILGTVSATAYLGASGGTGVSQLVDLTDVNIPNLATEIGEVLIVGGDSKVTTSSFEVLASNANLITQDELTSELLNYSTTSHNHALSSLTDVSATAVTAGQVLGFNTTLNRWVPSSLVIGVGGSGVTDHGALTGLADDDHPQYTLSSTNLILSAVVANHNADGTTHFLSSVVTNWALGQFQPGDATLSAIANRTTGSNVMIYFSGVDLAASTLATSAGRKFLACADDLVANDIFYYDGTNIVKLAGPADAGVLVINPGGTPEWLEPTVEDQVLTYNSGIIKWQAPAP
jgi:hypothetical protein